jgi:hypothetical protein
MATPTSPLATAGLILALDPGEYKTVTCADPGDPARSRRGATVRERGMLSTWPGLCDSSEEAGTEARPTGSAASVGRASLPAGHRG